MRTSRRWLTVIAAAGGLLIAGSPAIPAQAAPTGPICLTHSTHFCLVSNGTGRQVTIDYTPGNWSSFHIVDSGTDPVTGATMWQFENGNGNCLRAGTGNVVKIENGSCASTDGADWWIETNGPGGPMVSMFYRDKMLVHGTPHNGQNVWHDTTRSGDWAAWQRF